jgi:hypothetical protein
MENREVGEKKIFILVTLLTTAVIHTQQSTEMRYALATREIKKERLFYQNAV